MDGIAPWTHYGLRQDVRFGVGRIDELQQVLDGLSIRRPLLLTSTSRLHSCEGRTVRHLASNLAGVFDGAAPHVPISTVRSAVARAREVDADAVISLGGGASADLGKAVCHFAPRISDIDAGAQGQDALSHVAIPTTYSGAELTPFFGMLDETARRKRGAQRAELAPRAVVYDPNLTLSLPPTSSAETGINALAHCIEIAYSPHRTPEAEAIALAGIRIIVDSLAEVVARPRNLDARTMMLGGACLAGRALQNGRMGAHHGLAQLTGARTGIAHGLANAVLLPHVMRFNEDAVAPAMRAIGRQMGASDAPRAVAQFAGELGLPTRLSECGVTGDDLRIVAAACTNNRNVAANPRPVSPADALEILEAAW